jgi:hypothetical protein
MYGPFRKMKERVGSPSSFSSQDSCREREAYWHRIPTLFLDRTIGLSFALLQTPLLPSPSRPAETLASEPPEQRRLGGGSHGGRRLQRNGHGVRPLPPSSCLSRAYRLVTQSLAEHC